MEKVADDPIERQARKDKHAAWLKTEQADSLHDNRVELVRRYLQNPSQPLDWPNWKQPHELWFTGREDYWIPLAKAKQAELDTRSQPSAGKATTKPIPDTNKTIGSPVEPMNVTTSPVTKTDSPRPIHLVIHSTDSSESIHPDFTCRFT